MALLPKLSLAFSVMVSTTGRIGIKCNRATNEKIGIAGSIGRVQVEEAVCEDRQRITGGGYYRPCIDEGIASFDRLRPGNRAGRLIIERQKSVGLPNLADAGDRGIDVIKRSTARCSDDLSGMSDTAF